ncbi:hypothetical protein KAR91_84695 [Candidatus Pacearchaeota archaeon]|nr:hypothetical protein [Candidatus Pacearchaeota archaeon]
MYSVPIDQAYNQFTRMIWKETHRAAKQHPHRTRDSLFASACEAFVDAWNQYDETKAKFSTFLTNGIRKRFYLDKVKNRSVSACRPKQKTMDNLADHSAKSFDLSDFGSVLSKDARGVVHLALSLDDTDKQFRIKSQTAKQRYLAELLKKLKWGKKRISESFAEIHHVLCD